MQFRFKRSRKFSDRKKGNKNKKLILLGGLGLVIALFFFTTHLSFFSIKNIKVILDKINCVSEQETKDQSGVLGQSIFFIDNDLVKNKLKGKFICIQSVDISKQLPDKVKLTIFGREAVLALSTDKILDASVSAVLDNLSQNATFSAQASASAIQQLDKNYFLSDNEGFIFGNTDQNLYIPILLYWDSLKIGSKLDTSFVKKILLIFEKFKTLQMPINETKIYPSNDILINSNNPILFSLDGNVEKQLAALQLILEKAKISNDNMSIIDLRFDNPVVRFAPRKK